MKIVIQKKETTTIERQMSKMLVQDEHTKIQNKRIADCSY